MIQPWQLNVMRDAGIRWARGPSTHPMDGPVTRTSLEAMLATWCRTDHSIAGDGVAFLLWLAKRWHTIETDRIAEERGRQLREQKAEPPRAATTASRLAEHYRGRYGR